MPFATAIKATISHFTYAKFVTSSSLRFRNILFFFVEGYIEFRENIPRGQRVRSHASAGIRIEATAYDYFVGVIFQLSVSFSHEIPL